MVQANWIFVFMQDDQTHQTNDDDDDDAMSKIQIKDCYTPVESEARLGWPYRNEEPTKKVRLIVMEDHCLTNWRNHP